MTEERSNPDAPGGTDEVGQAALSRRDLLRASGVVASTIAPASSLAATTSAPADDARALPTNELGRTGVKVTRLGVGAGYPSYAAPLLEHAFKRGVRYYDNAYGYGNGQQESTLGEWATESGHRRDILIVTKAGICAPDRFYDKVTRALEHLRIDTIDLMMIHALEDPAVPLDESGQWTALKKRLVREKKIRFTGFSTHAEMDDRVRCVAHAAKSPWVDVAMVACDPLLLRTHDDLNRALDACVKAKIGLVAMKTTRGLGLKAAQRRGVPEGQARTETMPGFDKLGLSAFGAVHTGMYSDGRFDVVCSAMLNRRMIDENTQTARDFERPLTPDQWQMLEDGMRKLARATCPGCDGACRRAAGTTTDLCSIARYVAYAEEDGNRALGRSLYRGLPRDQREAIGADLIAARDACPARLNFAAILERARRLLG